MGSSASHPSLFFQTTEVQLSPKSSTFKIHQPYLYLYNSSFPKLSSVVYLSRIGFQLPLRLQWRNPTYLFHLSHMLKLLIFFLNFTVFPLYSFHDISHPLPLHSPFMPAQILIFHVLHLAYEKPLMVLGSLFNWKSMM